MNRSERNGNLQATRHYPLQKRTSKESKMADPVFSIIIPTLNSAGTLEKALKSISSQSFPSFEVQIVDGVSTDSTRTIAESFAKTDDRFVWHSAKDFGIYDAMNKGLEKANGNWIFFLGSDDVFYSDDVLEKVNRQINSGNVNLVYGDVELSRPIGYNNTDLIYDGEFTTAKLLRKNICHQSAFYHKSLFRKFGLFRTKYRIFSDYDFNLRCFGAAKPLYIKTIIARFNVDGTSDKHRDSDQLFFDDFLENMALVYSYPYSDPYFVGRKRELLQLLVKKLKLFKVTHSAKLVRIICYHTLVKNPITKSISESAVNI